MIDVRIRRDWEGKAAPLAEIFDLDEIDRIRRSLIGWGIVDVDDPDSQIVGQWVVDDGRAYFEFVIVEDD